MMKTKEKQMPRSLTADQLRDLEFDLLEEAELDKLQKDPDYQEAKIARIMKAGWRQVDGKVVRARS